MKLVSILTTAFLVFFSSSVLSSHAAGASEVTPLELSSLDIKFSGLSSASSGIKFELHSPSHGSDRRSYLSTGFLWAARNGALELVKQILKGSVISAYYASAAFLLSAQHGHNEVASYIYENRNDIA